MNTLLNKHGIQTKLLLPISAIFIVSMAILVTVIIQIQNKATTTLGKSVTDVLQGTTASVHHQFSNMEGDITGSLEKNLAQASDTLSENTSLALTEIKSQIIIDLEKNLQQNADSIAALMAQVAPRAILSMNFADLVAYVKSVTNRQDVIYAIYLKPDGKPITRYVDRSAPKIAQYMKNGAGRNKLEKMINASSNDPTVLIVEKEIALEGQKLGKVVLCMDRASIADKKKEVEDRFSELMAKNNDGIRDVLTSVSSLAVDKMQTALTGIAHQFDTSWKNLNTDIDNISATAKSKMRYVLSAIGVVFGLVMLCSIGALTRTMVLGPINSVVDGLREMATGNGDLTKRLLINSKDEIGTLASWFNQFVENLQGMIQELAANADGMQRSSADLSQISRLMSEGSKKTSDGANEVAAAGDQMRTNMEAVSDAVAQATNNVTQVATSVEEMTATIQEISQTSEKTRGKTDMAVQLTDATSTQVNDLGESAQEIGKVVETITEISEQVNLLALNATIEAARAGEAGKGFAVVANEIKELAKLTAESTSEIKRKINDIQASTNSTVTHIRDIVGTFGEVNELVAIIATAIHEQSATTQQISENLSLANAGLSEVNENVANSSTVVSKVADDIQEVKTAANEMSDSSSQVNLNAEHLAGLSDQLATMVGRFHF